jgi:4-hydroxybenzoate polyprenyltransferase
MMDLQGSSLADSREQRMKKLGKVFTLGIWHQGRFWLHFPLGLLIGAMAYWCWPAAICLVALFWFYESDEDESLKDKSFLDTQGALGGLIAASIGIGIWSLI